MEYLIDLKYEDNGYDAIVHFVATFLVNTSQEAKIFIEELSAAFERRNVKINLLRYYRIDNDLELLKRSREYHYFQHSNSTAKIQIEQFFVENPNQNKSLYENLTEKLFSGADSTAVIGEKYNIPVRVINKGSRNSISNDIYYFSVEHLIPKQ